MTRLAAISHIRAGNSISNDFVGNETVRGVPHTFRVRVGLGTQGEIKAVITCHMMRQLYTVYLTPTQLLSYIKRHYTT
jgi:hypothetical protein